MKKILLIAALSAACLTMSAQQKGDMAVGGVIGISGGSATTKTTVAGNSTSTTSPAATMLTFSPEFSYFAADNFEMDLSVGYTLSGDFFGDGEFMHVLDGSIGMHYYVHIIRNRFFYTPGFNLSFGGVKSVEVRDNGERFSQDGMPFVFGADLELGRFEFKANRHWGFSANLLTLQIATTTGITAYDRSTSIGVNLNCGITLGTMYYF